MASDPTQPGGRQPDLLGPEEDADIPPAPRGLAVDPLDDDAQERLHRMSRRGRALPTLLVVVAIGAFAAIVWWAYRTANQGDAPGEVPVVEAEPGEAKVRPESEGGMDVPNQDKLIYQQLGQSGSGGGEGQPEVERLLPPPEEPLEPPAPPPAATAESAPATGELTPPPPPQETPDEVVAETPSEGAAAAPEDEAAPAAGTEMADAPPMVPAPEPAPAAPVETQPAAPAPDAPAAEAPAEPEPAAPAAEEPATQVAAAGAFRVQLASVKNEAGALDEWARLQKAHAELLGPLEPTIQRADLGTQGVFYRIQGGPLPSREAADALCAQLKQKNQACLVVKP